MFRRGLVTITRGVGMGAIVLTMVCVSAMAVFADFTAPTLSTSEYTTTAAAVFTAIGAIWGLRKVIKLLNRS